MTLLISDTDVDELLTTRVSNGVMLEYLKTLEFGDSSSTKRVQIETSSGWLRIQPGLSKSRDCIGFKAYTVTHGFGPRYAVFLYRISTGELLAIIDADTLTVKRTGSLAGVATTYLAKKDSRELGVLGSSRQARSMIRSIFELAKLEEIKVYSPNRSHRDSFAQSLSSELGIKVTAEHKPIDAVANADIVGTASNNRTMVPILSGKWLKEGAHVNAIGAVGNGRVEIDSISLERASLVVVDSKEECLYNSQEVMNALESGVIKVNQVIELSKIVSKKDPRRLSDRMITVFKSVGSGGQDVYAASVVYALASKEKLGRDIGEVGPALRKLD